MKYELKTIGVWSFTKIAFFVNLAMGVLMGILAAIIVGFFLTVASALPPEFSELGGETQSFGFILIFMPIFYGLMSAVVGTIMCVILVLVYNLMARAVGGLEFTLEQIPDPWQQPSPPPGPVYVQQPPPQQPSGPPETPPPPRPAPPPAGETPPQHDDTRRPDDPQSFGPQQG